MIEENAVPAAGNKSILSAARHPGLEPVLSLSKHRRIERLITDAGYDARRRNTR